ncbi:PHR protein [Aphelenchoides avenae]|nr:PHR protein [Aphelenchus avenae]
MTAEEFARGPAADAVLTAEEKVQIFSWFNAAIPQSIFPDTPRSVGENYVCERFTRSNAGTWNVSGATHAIDFSVSRAVSITGFGACSFYDGSYQPNYSVSSEL